MKFKYIGSVNVINLTIGKRLAHGDIVDVPDSDPAMIQRFNNDNLYEPVQSVKTAKTKKGDK